MTDKSAVSLVDLARSWNYPAEMKVAGSAYRSEGYDYTQRAYILKTKKQGAKLELEFAASKDRPLFNLALVVKKWGPNNPALKIDGRGVPRGKDFRFGIEYDVEGNADLIVWIKKQAKKTTRISLSPGK